MTDSQSPTLTARLRDWIHRLQGLKFRVRDTSTWGTLHDAPHIKRDLKSSADDIGKLIEEMEALLAAGEATPQPLPKLTEEDAKRISEQISPAVKAAKRKHILGPYKTIREGGVTVASGYLCSCGLVGCSKGYAGQTGEERQTKP